VRSAALLNSAWATFGRRLGAAALALITGICGCRESVSPHGGDAEFQARRRLGAIASFYGDYLGEHGGPPKDEAAFRAFLDQRSAGIERMDVGGVDGLLTSPRDGQKVAIVYGKRVAPQGAAGMPWAAYEQSGIDGKRLAVQVRGQVVELSADELSSQIVAPGKR